MTRASAVEGPGIGRPWLIVTSAFTSNSLTLWNSSLHGLDLRVRASQRATARCASSNVLAKKAKPATSDPYSILPFDVVSNGIWVVL